MQQLAESRRARGPGRDERPLLETEAGLLAVALELERAGALAKVDELEDIADGDILQAAGDRHQPLTLYPATPGSRRGRPHWGSTPGVVLA